MNRKEILLLIPVGFLMIALAGISLYLYSHTFVSPWLICGISLSLGIISGGVCLALRRTKRWWRSLLLFAGITLLTACGLLSVNYLGRETASASHEQATIISKHTEERTRTRRAGRRYVATGGKYNVYFITIQFSNGFRKDLEVTPGEYIKIRTGRKKAVILTPGLLGWPVYSIDR